MSDLKLWMCPLMSDSQETSMDKGHMKLGRVLRKSDLSWWMLLEPIVQSGSTRTVTIPIMENGHVIIVRSRAHRFSSA